MMTRMDQADALFSTR